MASFPLRPGDWVALYTDNGNLQAFGQVEHTRNGDAWVEWGRKPRRVGTCCRSDGKWFKSIFWRTEGYCEPLCGDHIDQHRDRLWQLVSKRDLPALQAAFPECFKEER